MTIYTIIIATIHAMIVTIALNITSSPSASAELLERLKFRYMMSFLLMVPIYLKSAGFLL